MKHQNPDSPLHVGFYLQPDLLRTVIKSYRRGQQFRWQSNNRANLETYAAGKLQGFDKIGAICQSGRRRQQR